MAMSGVHLLQSISVFHRKLSESLKRSSLEYPETLMKLLSLLPIPILSTSFHRNSSTATTIFSSPIASSYASRIILHLSWLYPYFTSENQKINRTIQLYGFYVDVAFILIFHQTIFRLRNSWQTFLLLRRFLDWVNDFLTQLRRNKCLLPSHLHEQKHFLEDYGSQKCSSWRIIFVSGILNKVLLDDDHWSFDCFFDILKEILIVVEYYVKVITIILCFIWSIFSIVNAKKAYLLAFYCCFVEVGNNANSIFIGCVHGTRMRVYSIPIHKTSLLRWYFGLIKNWGWVILLTLALG